MKNIFMKFGTACLIAASMLLGGCGRGFLDTDPLSFYEPGATFTTESGLKAAMAICDRHLKLYYAADHNEMLPLGTEYMFSEMSVASATDKILMLDNIAEDLTPSSDSGEGTSEHNLDRTNSIWYFWKQTWLGIMYANTVIKYAPGVVGVDSTVRNAYIGRAYFHRSFRYMALLMQYGDVPLVTTIIDAPKQDYYSTKRDAILDMLIKDMEWAVSNVPEQNDMSQIGMVNKGACKVLLVKLYLARGEYQKAKSLCTQLIENCGYNLMQEPFGEFNTQQGVGNTWPIERNVIWDLHRCPNKLRSDNRELIMGMPNRGSDTESFVKMLTMRIMYPFFFNDNELKAPDGKPAMKNIKRNDPNYNPDMDYMRALGRGIATWRLTHYYNHAVWCFDGVEDDGDLRHSSRCGNWINMEDLKVNNKESSYYGQKLRLFDDQGTLLCQDTIRRWYSMPHYKLWIEDPVNDANISGSDGNRGATTGGNADWYLYRLAEVYLLRAEANLYLNKVQEAVEDVNLLRRRAHCNHMYTVAEFSIGSIMDERARELYFEEWRNCELTRVSLCLARSGIADEWGETYDLETFDKQSGTDMVGGSYWYKRCTRLGMYNHGPINIIKGELNYKVDKKNIYWPIPESAIAANSKGQLHQNFGYDGYDPSVKEWDNWQDAVAAEQSGDKTK